MQFRTDRRLLVPPAVLGALNVALGGGLLVARGLTGALRADANTAGAATLALLGGFFLVVAWRLSRYVLTVTAQGLQIGVTGLIPWGEIDRLDRRVTPGVTVYRVTAGRREIRFTSHMFPGHADLASLIGEHSDRSWTAAAD